MILAGIYIIFFRLILSLIAQVLVRPMGKAFFYYYYYL